MTKVVSTLVVFEWEEVNGSSNERSSSDGVNGCNIRRTKLRLEPGEGTIDRLLHRLAFVLLPPATLRDYVVEIFDSKHESSYVPLSTFVHHNDEQMTSRFGRIWRVRAILQTTSHLALPGRAFSDAHGFSIRSDGDDDDDDTNSNDTVRLLIHERHNQQDSTAFTVWDGGVLLAEYIKKYPAETILGKNVLELGSGTGLVGLTAAALGAKYVELTDLPEAMPLLTQNIKANQSLWEDVCEGTARQSPSSSPAVVVACSELDWYSPRALPTPPGTLAHQRGCCWDVILVADCVWTLDLVEPLIQTIRALLEQGGRGGSDLVLGRQRPELLISYQRRGHHVHKTFWEGLSNLLRIQELDALQLGINLPNPKLSLSRCTPK